MNDGPRAVMDVTTPSTRLKSRMLARRNREEVNKGNYQPNRKIAGTLIGNHPISFSACPKYPSLNTLKAVSRIRCKAHVTDRLATKRGKQFSFGKLYPNGRRDYLPGSMQVTRTRALDLQREN